MKITILCLLLISSWSVLASPRLSVTRFDQEVEHILEGCRGWEFTRQGQLRTVMESELSKQGVAVVERAEIRSIYADEHLMENLDRRTKPKRHKFVAAQYTLIGAITELGICDGGSASRVQLGGLVGLLGGPSDVDLSVGEATSTAKVKVTAKLVSTETGEIIRTFSAEAESTSSGAVVSAGMSGVGGSHVSRKLPPVEQASNRALADLATQIAAAIR